MNLLLLACLFSLLYGSDSYKILVCYPMPVRSLNILGQGAVRHLLNDGHEVTFITNYPLNTPQSNKLRQIALNNSFPESEDFNIAFILENKIKQSSAKELQELAKDIARQTFENENVMKLIQNPNEHFDAIVVDLFESEVYAGLSVLYNCPMVWLYSMGAHWQVIRLIADSGNPAYDTNYLGTYTPPFTFAQRIEELYSRINWSFFKTFVTIPKEREIYENTFRQLLAKKGLELPDYEEVIYNSSLIFGNEHNAIIARPSVPPNFKFIGGFHVEDKIIPLSKNLQNIMDNAPNGVIYFSMGTFWKSRMLPKKLVRELLDMFRELKETVIWKFEEDLPDLPKNVHTVQWAPQQSILGHPNCKLFVSHGGLLSSIESVHFGVPVIGIPVLFDQIINVIKAVYNGYAIKVDLNYDMPKNLRVAIDAMVNDDTYLNKAKELSSIYHDQLAKPGAELVHWVKHVIRTRGAPHMRSPAANTPLYQRLYLDLAVIVLAIIYIINSLIKRQKPNKNVGKKKRN